MINDLLPVECFFGPTAAWKKHVSAKNYEISPKLSVQTQKYQAGWGGAGRGGAGRGQKSYWFRRGNFGPAPPRPSPPRLAPPDFFELIYFGLILLFLSEMRFYQNSTFTDFSDDAQESSVR
jgi:hypothetical protein